jgi:hypothetical protein
MITTPAQKVFCFVFYAFAIVHCCRAAGSLDVDMVEKPFFMLLSELSSFVLKHLHLKVSMEVAFLFYQGASTVLYFVTLAVTLKLPAFCGVRPYTSLRGYQSFG